LRESSRLSEAKEAKNGEALTTSIRQGRDSIDVIDAKTAHIIVEELVQDEVRGGQ